MNLTWEDSYVTLRGVFHWLRLYRLRDQGVAAIEAALMFPVLMTMLVSMVDIGNAFLSNQKLVSAAQTMGDLVTRESNPTLAERADAIEAGRAAMSPYSLDSFEYNISSFQFTAGGSPDLVWEETSGLTIGSDIINGMDALGDTGDGVVVVRVTYQYRPFFTGFVIGPINMEEYAYLRGRKSAVVGNPA